MAMSTSGRFGHDDLVGVIKTDEKGTVKGVRQANHGYVYQVQLAEIEGTEIEVPEEWLELVKRPMTTRLGDWVSYPLHFLSGDFWG
jgi:hypothetical protein